MIFAVVENGSVINRIELAAENLLLTEDSPARYNPGEGRELVPDPNGLAKIGGIWNGEEFGEAPATQEDLIAYAARVRFEKEVGGISVGGVPVATDRESQAMVAGAFGFIRQNPSAVIKWKSESGFATLDADAITAIANAIGSHVQACFSKECDVAEAIAAETVSSFSQIDEAFASL